jgi:hypothetical protein
MYVHIHAPPATAKAVCEAKCPDCKQRTRMLQWFTPWYGWDSTCIKCGRRWSDGEWQALDFVRQSRQKSIENAKAIWRKLPPVSENHYGTEL